MAITVNRFLAAGWRFEKTRLELYKGWMKVASKCDDKGVDFSRQNLLR